MKNHSELTVVWLSELSRYQAVFTLLLQKIAGKHIRFVPNKKALFVRWWLPSTVLYPQCLNFYKMRSTQYNLCNRRWCRDFTWS